MNRYASAIEADFARFYPGKDLRELVRGREFRHLLNLIDHLPGHSFYSEAVSQDEEHAVMLVRAMEGQEKKPYAPARSTWTPEVDMLAQILDALRHLTSTTVGVNGGKPREVKPVPRPSSMLDKAKRAQRRAKHEALVARVLPDQREDDE